MYWKTGSSDPAGIGWVLVQGCVPERYWIEIKGDTRQSEGLPIGGSRRSRGDGLMSIEGIKKN